MNSTLDVSSLRSPHLYPSVLRRVTVTLYVVSPFISR